MLGEWTVELSSGFKKAQAISPKQPSLQDAFAAAEKWMSVNRGRNYSRKTRRRLAERLPTNAQVREIRRQGLDVDWTKMNAGQVEDMLDYRKAQPLSRARQKVGVAQCSADAPSSVASAIIDSGTKPQAPDEDSRTRQPKAVACVPSYARDTAFASQCTSWKSSAHGPRSETHAHQRPRVTGSRRKIRLADVGLDGVTQTILGRGRSSGSPPATACRRLSQQCSACPWMPCRTSPTPSRTQAGGTA